MKSHFTALNDAAKNSSLYDNQAMMIDFRASEYAFLNPFKAQILRRQNIRPVLKHLYHPRKMDFYIQFLQNLIYFSYLSAKNDLTKSYSKKLTTNIIEILSQNCSESFYIWIDPKEKYTILNSLSTNGDLENIKLLMNFLKNKYKNNPQMIFEIIMHKEKNGYSSISSAAHFAYFEIVKYLFDFTSEFFGSHSQEVKKLHYSRDKAGNLILHQAVRHNNLEMVKFLYLNFKEYCDNHYPEEFEIYFSELSYGDFTTLNSACVQSNLPIAAYLLEKAEEIYSGKNITKFKEYISKPEKRNCSPLMNACRHGQREIAWLLINAAKKVYEDDVNGFQDFLEFKNDGGYCPLTSARAGNHHDCETALLLNGAGKSNVKIPKTYVQDADPNSNSFYSSDSSNFFPINPSHFEYQRYASNLFCNLYFAQLLQENCQSVQQQANSFQGKLFSSRSITQILEEGEITLNDLEPAFRFQI